MKFDLWSICSVIEMAGAALMQDQQVEAWDCQWSPF
jgi:hypothetical protein